MQIYFQHIRYKGSPLIWEYDPHLNKAICTSRLHDAKKPLTKEDIKHLLAELTKITGVSVVSNKATIDNCKVFFQTHPLQKISQYALDLTQVIPPDDSPLSGHTIIRSKSSPDFKDSSGSGKNTPGSADQNKAQTGLGFFERTIYEAASLRLDDLIPKNNPSFSAIAGATTCYEKDLSKSHPSLKSFKQKMPLELIESRKILIKTTTNLLKELTIKRYDILYDIKGEFIAEIRDLFDNYLAPYYHRPDSTDSAPTMQIADYFRKVIVETISSQHFVSTGEECIKLKQNLMGLANFSHAPEFVTAYTNMAHSPVKTLLRPLFYLIDPAIDDNLITSDPNLLMELRNFKNCLKSSTGDIYKKMIQIENIAYKLCLYQYETYTKITQLKELVNKSESKIDLDRIANNSLNNLIIHDFFCDVYESVFSIVASYITNDSKKLKFKECLMKDLKTYLDSDKEFIISTQSEGTEIVLPKQKYATAVYNLEYDQPYLSEALATLYKSKLPKSAKPEQLSTLLVTALKEQVEIYEKTQAQKKENNQSPRHTPISLETFLAQQVRM